MVPITQLPALVRDIVTEWRNTRAATLLFAHRDTAILALTVMIGLCVLIVAVGNLQT